MKKEVHVDERLEKLVEYSMRSGQIDGKLYEEYDVKRGLRDSSGKGEFLQFLLCQLLSLQSFKAV